MMGNMFGDAISQCMEVKREQVDYTGDDGLLYCGKCHTPKQMRLSVNQVADGVLPRLVPTTCQCQREADKETARRAEQEKFLDSMKRRWEDNISCPDALCFSFADDDRKEPRVSDTCLRYVEHWEEMRKENIGLLFYGSVGTGKSFFASCIGKALLDKMVPVATTNFPRLLNLLQGPGERQKLLDRLAVYKLLILDDLGVERDSTYVAEQIFNVIDARSRSGLPVIVTTNLTLEELENPGSMQYARIYDRVLDMCPVRIKLAGESRRRGNSEVRKAKAKKLLLG